MIAIQWADGIRRPHDPNARERYRWNWNGWLEGETITEATVIAEGGITATVAETGPDYVDVFVEGGSCGSVGKVVCRVTSSGGRRQDRGVSFDVQER